MYGISVSVTEIITSISPVEKMIGKRLFTNRCSLAAISKANPTQWYEGENGKERTQEARRRVEMRDSGVATSRFKDAGCRVANLEDWH